MAKIILAFNFPEFTLQTYSKRDPRARSTRSVSPRSALFIYPLRVFCFPQSELSQSLQSLSEKAKSGTEFIQRLKKMADSVSGNCAEFEKTVVSQCDALIEVIKQRKAELLENVAEEKEMKVRTLKEQVSDCTALLQRTTGLLQFCIEVLKESDAPSFLQVSAGLVSRVATADANFNKEMELAPRVSPEFELTIDNTAAIHAIENMSFFQMKGLFPSPDRWLETLCPLEGLPQPGREARNNTLATPGPGTRHQATTWLGLSLVLDSARRTFVDFKTLVTSMVLYSPYIPSENELYPLHGMSREDSAPESHSVYSSCNHI
ncbi:hypothetical protein RRG08_053190 [Elysia crispata]|uniref:COS domain-containing protein n=1 Tax=Elysia crispata TaxID=231223 RepID=A0AAE1D2S8_9GAST|nr:hypothetical protein RRG08_053190 [Elysia crispata]